MRPCGEVVLGVDFGMILILKHRHGRWKVVVQCLLHNAVAESRNMKIMYRRRKYRLQYFVESSINFPITDTVERLPQKGCSDMSRVRLHYGIT